MENLLLQTDNDSEEESETECKPDPAHRLERQRGHGQTFFIHPVQRIVNSVDHTADIRSSVVQTSRMRVRALRTVVFGISDPDGSTRFSVRRDWRVLSSSLASFCGFRLPDGRQRYKTQAVTARRTAAAMMMIRFLFAFTGLFSSVFIQIVSSGRLSREAAERRGLQAHTFRARGKARRDHRSWAADPRQ